MAKTGPAVRSKLLTVSDVTDLVGTRIRPDALSQKETLPAIAYTQIISDHLQGLGGPIGLTVVRMLVGCFGDSHVDAENLGDKVRLALDGESGTFGSEEVDICLLEEMDHEYIEPNDASDRGLYVTNLIFSITLVEATS